jgi:hypothetical protein
LTEQEQALTTSQDELAKSREALSRAEQELTELRELSAVATGQPWQTVAASFGVPGSLAALLLFFTTWGDIRGIIEATKGGA